jgi:two-component system sensor histidine kinase MtrB
VRDSGPGIPEESLPFVFERFYRADKARARAEGGSGLGLAIARQLARAHGGELSAANHPEGGAAFTLRLPVARR